MLPTFVSLDDVIRQAMEGQERSPGHVVPDIAGRQAPGVGVQDRDTNDHLPEAGEVAGWVRRGARGPARQGRPNDFGWMPQDRMEILTYAESIAIVSPTDGAVTLDPNFASAYLISASESFSITISDIIDDSGVVEYRPTPQRVYSFVVMVRRQAGGVAIVWPGGTKWSKETTNPKGVETPDPDDSLLATPADPSFDVFVLTVIPTVGIIGQVAGLGFA